MQLRVLLIITGVLVACLGASMLLALFVAWYYADGLIAMFSALIAAMLIVGILLTYIGRLVGSADSVRLSAAGALAIVGFSWVVASLVGALPFILAGELSLTNAVFETASGFTTTGASVLTDIEIFPESLLMWRSLTQWLGGMGIIVLSLAVLPLLGVGGMQLYKAEVPGPSPDKLTPRVRDTAILLWKVYALLTLVGIVALIIAGMTLFDAINHTFTAVSTGGFSTKNASVAAFASPTIQWILIVLMFVSAMNFALHYKMLCGNFKVYLQDRECMQYILWVSVAVLIIALALWEYDTLPVVDWASFEYLLRTVVFQVVSLVTTTGFVTADYSLWPSVTLCVIIILMFMGGSAGSTAGGLKVMRVTVLFQLVRRDLFQLVHPHAVCHLKIGGKSVSTAVITAIVSYVVLFIVLLAVGTIFLAITGLDMETAFTASLTCLSNVGPGLGSVGPVNNFNHLTDSAKWVLSAFMLLGRLEIYALVIPFVPEFWKH